MISWLKLSSLLNLDLTFFFKSRGSLIGVIGVFMVLRYNLGVCRVFFGIYIPIRGSRECRQEISDRFSFLLFQIMGYTSLLLLFIHVAGAVSLNNIPLKIYVCHELSTQLAQDESPYYYMLKYHQNIAFFSRLSQYHGQI